MRIYIGRDGKRYGPLSLDELNAHLESGRVQQGDLAWFDGAVGWGPISSIPGVRLPRLDVSSRPSPVASRDSNIKKASGYSSPPNSDPSLWNPNAAVNWSILFGVPLGAFLHARNWRAMGDHRKEKVALIWFWVIAALEAICILLDIGGKVYGGIWLWSLILWYFTSARAQANYIQQTYGSSYPRNGFVKPLLIALACYFGAALVSVGIQTVISHDPATGMASTSEARERAPVVPPRPASTPASQASTRSGEQKTVASVPATVRVERLALGPSVNTSQQVVGESITFSPEQTIYASVSTTGAAPAATMTVKWFYRETGDLVNTSSQVIAPNGPAVTSFHISKPDGWPIGGYQVQIYLDNVLAAQRDFNVSPQRLSETATDKTIIGKCLLEVSGRRYIDGRCPIRMSSDGSFVIGASESEPLTYFATVAIVGKDVGDGQWNEESGASHAHTPLGALRRSGACWENSAAKVCAERLADQTVPPSSLLRQAAPEQRAGVRFTDADLKALECSTTFEQGRWSSAENEHGITMTATDGEKLYIGKSCDVTSSRFGNGRWAWANGGVRFQFESCFIGWPHAEPPIDDNDCKWAN